MDRIESLKRFIRVAELHSFTRAADSLGIPKAGVSQAIQQLETRLHTQLFHRTTRKVQLTPDGIQFYEKCLQVLAEMDELETLFDNDDQHLQGLLRVNMSQPLARHVVIPQLPAFLQRYPHLRIDISSDDRKVDLVAEGYDCVIRTGSLTDSGLIQRPLGSMRQLNMVSPAYLARYGRPETLTDLSQHRLIHYHASGGSRLEGFEYWDGMQCQTLPMSGTITVNNTDAYRAACLAGLGIMQAPRLGAQAYLQSGELVEILSEWQAPAMPVSLLYPQRRNLSKRVRVWMGWLAGLLPAYLS